MARSLYKILPVFWLFLFFSLQGLSQTPVLLRVVRGEQHDTLGCNIVAEITSWVYKQVLSGKVKLWDTPDKEIQITGASLLEIERSSQTSFPNEEIIYIYEYWTGSGKNLKSVTMGFSFSGKSKKGENVSYGFVDFKDVEALLLNTTVQCNANGNFNTTINYYLGRKNYYYHIIQYGGNVIDNINKSEELKAELTGPTGRFPSPSTSGPDVPQKIVTWVIDDNDKTDLQKNVNALLFEKSLQDYLHGNKEIFFNLGGDKISTYVDGKSRLLVTKIEVKEVWKKIKDQIQYDPVSVIIYVNDSALNEILYRDMFKMDIMIGGKTWIDFIKEKEFPYEIQKINNQVIHRNESFIYIKALQTYEWHKLTEFVKYY